MAPCYTLPTMTNFKPDELNIQEDEPLNTLLASLGALADKLEQEGLQPCRRLLNLANLKDTQRMGTAMPLVEDGMNGARFEIDGSSQPRLSFTNLFSEPDDPTRLLIQKLWDEVFEEESA